MKKSILILCTILAGLSLTAFGYVNWSITNVQEEKPIEDTVNFNKDFVDFVNQQSEIDLFYNVDSRFRTTITKENLRKVKSITDIFPKKVTKLVESYQTVEVVILDNDRRIKEIGSSEVLNSSQIKLLQSIDYSTNFYISTNCRRKNAMTGMVEDDSLIYYMTIIPEKEAVYTEGNDALISYLRENSEKENSIIFQKDQLKPGKVSFTVTQKGEVSNVKLTSTSGYSSMDKTMIKLITTIPGKWNPATNSKGINVDQEFVFFYGIIGC